MVVELRGRRGCRLVLLRGAEARYRDVHANPMSEVIRATRPYSVVHGYRALLFRISGYKAGSVSRVSMVAFEACGRLARTYASTSAEVLISGGRKGTDSLDVWLVSIWNV